MPFSCLSFHFTCQDGEQAKSETGVKLFLLLHSLLPLPLLADWRYFALVTYGYIVAGAGAGAAAGRSWSWSRRRRRSNSKVRKLPERQRRPPWKLWCNLYLILPHVYIKATRAHKEGQNYTQPHSRTLWQFVQYGASRGMRPSFWTCSMFRPASCPCKLHIQVYTQTNTHIDICTYVYSIYL